jgi:putative Holliday junction resolvase
MSPLLGIDYGTSRIGLAVSDAAGKVAIALGTHHRATDGPLFPYLQRLIQERGITGLVIGLPLRADGSEGQIAWQTRQFARKLAGETRLPVTFVDERYTSQEATASLRSAKRRRRAKREVDALAAQLILQLHLDRLERSQPPGDQE